MLSDEEKEALEKIDYIQDFIIENGQYNADVGDMQYFSRILNLIEKQSKEIEHQIEKRANQRNELAILNAKQVEFNKLVNTVNSYKGQFKRQQKEIEELKNVDLTTVYLNGIYDGEKKVEDKIKAKIEEVKDGTFDAKIVLQSLLEKE